MAGYNTEELGPVGQVPHIGAEKREMTVQIMKELDKDWADEMLFMEEPVEIRILPPNERNPPRFVHCEVNGMGCEIWSESRKSWRQWKEVPVNVIITIKRKYLETLLRSRITRISLADFKPGQGEPDPTIYRDTTAAYSIDIINDKNPEGRDWVESIRRQGY